MAHSISPDLCVHERDRTRYYTVRPGRPEDNLRYAKAPRGGCA